MGLQYFSDAKEIGLQLTEIYEEPQDGINVNLTIDYKIQAALLKEN